MVDAEPKGEGGVKAPLAEKLRADLTHPERGKDIQLLRCRLAEAADALDNFVTELDELRDRNKSLRESRRRWIGAINAAIPSVTNGGNWNSPEQATTAIVEVVKELDELRRDLKNAEYLLTEATLELLRRSCA